MRLKVLDKENRDSTYHMSRVMRKPAFRICENKDADQLRSNYTADQRLYFRYIAQFLYFLDPKFQASSHILWLYSPVVSDRSETPKDRFCGDAAHKDSANYNRKAPAKTGIDQHGQI